MEDKKEIFELERDRKVKELILVVHKWEKLCMSWQELCLEQHKTLWFYVLMLFSAIGCLLFLLLIVRK
jgi:hypothetical protein